MSTNVRPIISFIVEPHLPGSLRCGMSLTHDLLDNLRKLMRNFIAIIRIDDLFYGLPFETNDV